MDVSLSYLGSLVYCFFLFFFGVIAFSPCYGEETPHFPLLLEGRATSAEAAAVQLLGEEPGVGISALRALLSRELIGTSPPAFLLPIYRGKELQWLSLSALLALSPQQLEQLPESYRSVRNGALAFQQSLFYPAEGSHSAWERLLQQLNRSYAEQTSLHRALPSVRQLQVEAFYLAMAWHHLLVALYLLSVASACLQISVRLFPLFFWSSYLVHTLFLLLRIYLLGRPPVATMMETAFYVPWVVVTLTVLPSGWRGSRIVRAAGCAVAALFFSVTLLSERALSLSLIAPVLQSSRWLTIHVLCVVGSYAFFSLASFLAHLFIVGEVVSSLYRFESRFSVRWKAVSLQIVRSSYLIAFMGTALLIAGTLLGGAWAAESWGRFWDWDPKEAWAFITGAVYLSMIHGYQFGKLSSQGLSLALIAGGMVMSFTWYGVNYLLGTGLHSYGFGAGGEKLYFLFLGGELLFIVVSVLCLQIARRRYVV